MKGKEISKSEKWKSQQSSFPKSIRTQLYLSWSEKHKWWWWTFAYWI